MKMEMTERDKKLLVMLSIFVIVVGIGYWGVFGAVKGILAANADIVKQESIKNKNDLKLAQIPMLEVDNEKLENEIVEARKQYYPMMNSAEIDRYITDLILSHGLSSYDLKITISDRETELAPYQYTVLRSEDPEEETSGGQSVTFEEEPSTGIYTAGLSLRLGGDEAQLRKFLNGLLDTDRKLRVMNYQWGSERSVNMIKTESENEAGEYEIVTVRTLSIGLEMYMCEE